MLFFSCSTFKSNQMMVLAPYYLKKQSVYMFYLVQVQQKNIDVHLHVNHLLIGKILLIIYHL